MFFEEELGFKPARWLHNEQLDAVLDDNCIAVQPIEELIVRQTGLHLSMIRLIVAAILTVPLGFLHRVVPSAVGRHLYALVTGVALLYYPFGNQVWLVIVSSLLTYVTMLVAPRMAGRLAWCIAFPFLLICMERTGDLWDTGAVDITGSLMVLVLKQVALGYNLSDARNSKRSAEFGVERQYYQMSSAPNILHYFSYIFASGNLLAGPFFEYRDYIDFTSRKGKFAEACNQEHLGAAAKSAMQCFGLATASIAVSQTVAAYFTPHMLVPPQVRQLAMWQRYGIAFLLGAGKRCQYYFIWGLSEAGINASGFGFNGFIDQDKLRPRFNRYRNTQVYQVETCYSIAQVPKYWNVNTGVFLRRYVYERVGKGFVGLAVTQLVSGLWHGLREGHMLFFAMSIPLFAGSKVVYKQEKRLPKSVYESVPWKFFKWFISHAQLNIFCQTFMLQKWHLCWESVKSFYGVPHIVSFGILALGEVLPVPRAYKQLKRDMAEANSVEETHREMDKVPTGKSRSAGMLPKPPSMQHEDLKRR